MNSFVVAWTFEPVNPIAILFYCKERNHKFFLKKKCINLRFSQLFSALYLLKVKKKCSFCFKVKCVLENL